MFSSTSVSSITCSKDANEIIWPFFFFLIPKRCRLLLEFVVQVTGSDVTSPLQTLHYLQKVSRFGALGAGWLNWPTFTVNSSAFLSTLPSHRGLVPRRHVGDGSSSALPAHCKHRPGAQRCALAAQRAARPGGRGQTRPETRSGGRRGHPHFTVHVQRRRLPPDR